MKKLYVFCLEVGMGGCAAIMIYSFIEIALAIDAMVP